MSKKSKSKKSSMKGRVSISVIEALSEGLYENILDVVREYVQNAYDAIGEKYSGDYSKGLIQIIQSMKKDSLIIHDNGCGMDEDGLDRMVSIGFSTKSSSDVGFRGIGSLAGFTVAKKVIFVSRDTSSSSLWVLTIDADSIIRMCNDPNIRKNPMLIDKAYDMFVTIEKAHEGHTKLFNDLLGKHSTGTTIILQGIYNKCGNLLDFEKLEEYIARRLPVEFSADYEYNKIVTRALRKNVPNWNPVTIELNGKKIFKIYKDDDGDDDVVRKKVIKDDSGIPLAFIWYTMRYMKKTDELTRGLVLVVKGFTVLDAKQTINQILQFTTHDHGYWVSGEIHILSTDVVPTTSRGNLKDNPAKEKLLSYFEDWSKGLQGDIRDRSTSQSAARKDKKHVKTIQRQVAMFNKKAQKALTTKADIDHMKTILDTVETRTKEELESISTKYTKIIDDLESTLELIDDVRSQVLKIKPIATITRLGLTGKAKIVYTTIEKAIIGFPFDKYSKNPEILKAELASYIYQTVMKKVNK